MAKRYKILMIAEAANPEWVSVPLVGWSLYRALSKVADVHLVTQVRNRDAIVRAGLIEGTDFTTINSEALAAPLWKFTNRFGSDGLGWTLIQATNAISYPWFERLVWKAFGDRLKAGEFDIVHRITPVSPAVSSPIAGWLKRIGVPFVVGPLNGGVPWPKGFESEMRKEKEWLSLVRSAYKLMPGRRAMLGADAIILGARATVSDIPKEHHDRCILLPENAIDRSRFNLQATYGALPLRACFIGRFAPIKGTEMLLDAAMPLLKDGRLVLDMIGDGPLADTLRDMVAAGGAQEAVRFHGWLPHQKIQEIACQSSLFVFPSIREFGGGAVLEAMALGIVPVVADYGGPSELVTEDTGYKIAMGTRDDVVAGFRAQLERIAASPEGLAAMGGRAKARVEELFTWERKAEQILNIYSWVLGDRAEKPCYFGEIDEPSDGSGEIETTMVANG